jgi:flagellar FliL protein
LKQEISVAEEKEEKKENKGSALKFVIIGLLVLLLAVVGLLVWQILGSSNGGPGDAVEIDEIDSALEEDTMSQTYALETFVVNLNDPGGKRYLKTTIELEYLTEDVGAELLNRLPQLRDLILLQLSSKGLEDIQSVDGKIALRRELLQRINQTLTSGKVRNLYFTQFVIQ